MTLLIILFLLCVLILYLIRLSIKYYHDPLGDVVSFNYDEKSRRMDLLTNQGHYTYYGSCTVWHYEDSKGIMRRAGTTVEGLLCELWETHKRNDSTTTHKE